MRHRKTRSVLDVLTFRMSQNWRHTQFVDFPSADNVRRSDPQLLGGVHSTIGIAEARIGRNFRGKNGYFAASAAVLPLTKQRMDSEPKK